MDFAKVRERNLRGVALAVMVVVVGGGRKGGEVGDT